jgi:cyclopropane fatty-acyl-phospholipid synthase-like methyltransferase
MAQEGQKNNDSIRAFDRLAELYQEKFMELGIYNESYDEFCLALKKKGSKILDAGCGPANISRYLIRKRPDLSIKGYDLSPNMIQLAKANVPEGNFSIFDCRDLHLLNDKFDGIISGFCFPYFSLEECHKFISDSAALLNEHGLLYFSLIEGNYSDSGFESSSDGKDKSFVHYYRHINFEHVLTKNDFQILKTFRIPYKKRNDVEDVHLIIIARRK